MKIKKFYEYDMRDEFSFPVYVSYQLTEFDGIKGVDPNHHFAGQLTRKNGETFLELSDYPEKKELKSSTIVIENSNKVGNQSDSGEWYACTWDGQLQFVLHKYFCVDASMHISNHHFGGDISKWVINDYSIVDQYTLSDESVTHVKLSMDHVYSWFGFYRPEQNWEKTKSRIFKDLKFEDQLFSLSINAEGTEQHKLHLYQKTAYMYFNIEFKTPQTRDFAYNLAIVIRNFFQVLTGKKIGISRIILNKKNNGSLTDERENWFLEQSFLPNIVEETNHNFDISYHELTDKFDHILELYLSDLKIQKFAATFLLVDHFRLPVDIQIVTLVSAVESYYNNAKYVSNGKTIQKAADKLERLGKLVEDPDDLVSRDNRSNITSSKELFNKMVDSRDYIVHGVKENKYTSESDLVPDLIIFKNLIRHALIRVISLQVEQNN